MARAARLVLLLAACSGPRAPEPIENRASARTAVQCTRAKGKVIERGSREPAVGATIVFSGVAGAGEDVVITDENGAFDLRVAPDRTTITVYYTDKMHTEPFLACDGIQIKLDTTASGRSNSNLP